MQEQGETLEQIASELEQGEAVQGEYQSAEETKEPPKVNTGEMVASLLQITFNKILAPKRGKHWMLTTGEAGALGDAYGEVIDKYFPDISAGPEATAVLVTLVIVGPRLSVDSALREEREAKSKEETQRDAGQTQHTEQE